MENKDKLFIELFKKTEELEKRLNKLEEFLNPSRRLNTYLKNVKISGYSYKKISNVVIKIYNINKNEGFFLKDMIKKLNLDRTSLQKILKELTNLEIFSRKQYNCKRGFAFKYVINPNKINLIINQITYDLLKLNFIEPKKQKRN